MLIWGPDPTPIDTTAPDFFTEDTPTAVLVRQVLGAVAQFDKATTIAKLKAARDRKREATGKCEGRKSYAEARPETVAVAKQLSAAGLSYRKIAAQLATEGHMTANRKPYVARARCFRSLNFIHRKIQTLPRGDARRGAGRPPGAAHPASGRCLSPSICVTCNEVRRERIPWRRRLR